MVTTGLVHVAGEVTTAGLRRHPQHRPRDDPRHRLRLLEQGLRRRAPAASRLDRRAVPGHRPGRRHRLREPHRRRRPARQAGRRRPGPDVRLRLRGHPRADAAADLPGAPAGRAPDRGPQVRRGRLPAPRRQDPGHHRVRRRQARSGSTPSCCPPSTPPTSRWSGLLAPDIAEHVDRAGPRRAGRRRHRPGHQRLPAAGQPDRPVRDRRPDGRRRPDRPQDHRRHLRRHGPPRRRRLLRQGPVARSTAPRPTRCAGWPRTSSPPGWPAAARCRSPTPSARPSRSACTSRRSAPRAPRSTRSRARSPRCSTCGPAAIIDDLDLLRPIYQPTAAYGHFGRTSAPGVRDGFTWERTDRVEAAAGRRRRLSRPPCGTGDDASPDRPAVPPRRSPPACGRRGQRRRCHEIDLGA